MSRDRVYVVYGSIPREPVVVFDIDGVLFNCDERLRKSLEELGARSLTELTEDQKTVLGRLLLSEKYLHLDKPNAEAVETAKRTAHPVVIITGRPARLAEVTMRQLREFGIPFTAVVFRADEYIEKSQKHDYKEIVVRELGLRIVEAHDDSEKVCKMYTKYTNNVYLWVNYKPVRYVAQSQHASAVMEPFPQNSKSY